MSLRSTKETVDIGEDSRMIDCVHQGAGQAESCFNRRSLRHHVHVKCLRANHIFHGMTEA
jgi:hypothetical protein